jgi:septal ring factor EnvC (AmiA/AmiB activator)
MNKKKNKVGRPKLTEQDIKAQYNEAKDSLRNTRALLEEAEIINVELRATLITLQNDLQTQHVELADRDNLFEECNELRDQREILIQVLGKLYRMCE